MENHYLDAPDNSEPAPEHLQDRSDLSILYPTPGQEDKRPLLMSDQERYAKQDRETAKAKKHIRRYGVPLGLLLAGPIVAALAVIGFVLSAMTNERAMYLVLGSILVLGITIFAWMLSYKKIDAIFHAHDLRGGPFILTGLGVMTVVATTLWVVAPVTLTNILPSVQLYGAALLVTGVVFGNIIVFGVTSRLPR